MTTKTRPPAFPAAHIGVLSGLEIIGDGLIKLPFLRALRAAWPTATIHWITTKGPTVYTGALRDTVAPLIDRVHVQPSWLDGAKDGDEAAPPFDLMIDTRGRWRLALQARRHLPHQMFIAPAFRYLLSDKRPPLFAPRKKQMIDRLLQTVELAAGFMPEVTRRLPVTGEMMGKARRILPEGQIYVGFAPGAGNAIKKWPAESFEKLAKLQVRMNRIPVFILGPQEMDLYDRLFRAIPEAIFPLQAYEVWGTKELSVEQTLAIGHCLDLAVTNDSGTSHMLAAVDCPLVSLFGPTSAKKLAPRVSQSTVICAQDFGGDEMALIPVEAVHEAVNRAIILQGKV
ncbi:MAG TPA: heptosyltransferase [Rhodospirillaceae bacterium]|nr:heptosyltransferase [Rhodospirillaceae bacterium]